MREFNDPKDILPEEKEMVELKIYINGELRIVTGYYFISKVDSGIKWCISGGLRLFGQIKWRPICPMNIK